MKIVPAILAENFDDFTALLAQAESFTDYVQIDIMDGVFVESKSFPVEGINEVATPLIFEVHLMVKDPLSTMSKITHRGLRKVIFHFEAVTDHCTLISEIRRRGFVPGMAVNPETGTDRFEKVIGSVDTLLFLTVDPCCYGRPFRPEVLEKIAEVKKAFPDKVIAADGGVSLENLKGFHDIGTDYVCVGSRIFLKGDAGTNYRLFLEKLRELEQA